jgi:hypothetical protein
LTYVASVAELLLLFHSRDHLRNFQETLSALLEEFLQNNLASRNLHSLVTVFIEKCNKLRETPEGTGESTLLLIQTYNAALILQICLRHLLQTLTEDVVLKHFTGTDDASEPVVQVQGLLVTCIVALSELPASGQWYHLTTEIMSILMILLSVQMYSARPAQKSVIYRVLMSHDCSIHALPFVKTLVSHFIRQDPSPKPEDAGGSIVLGLASGLWNVLSLGYGKAEETPEEAVIGKMSVFLLLVLTNHCTAEGNKYREALFSCQDSQGKEGDVVANPKVFRVDYSSLLNTFSSIPNDDETTLLLYLLLHKNYSFRNFVMSRASDLDLIVLPILRVIYDCPERNSHHVYMALIILLILSEDNLFNETVHDLVSYSTSLEALLIIF